MKSESMIPGLEALNMVQDRAHQGRQEGPLRSSFADDPDMRDIVALFVKELPARIRALETWHRQDDLESFRNLVHQLKGAGGGYGFMPISEQAETLLRLLDQGSEEWKPRIHAALERFLCTLRRADGTHPDRAE